jgi:hypothetical protein
MPDAGGRRRRTVLSAEGSWRELPASTATSIAAENNEGARAKCVPGVRRGDPFGRSIC